MFVQGSHKALALLAAQAFLASALASYNASPPGFHLTLKPDFSPSGYKLFGAVQITDSFAANETVALIPTTIASIRTAQYGANDIIATDDEGIVSLTMREIPSGPFGLPSRSWVAQRATRGPVTFSFTASPVVVDPSVLPGPLFDIRKGPGGLTGSMWSLVPVPNPMSTTEYNITVSWDIPDIQAAAFTWADGQGSHSHSFTGTVTELLQTFFIVGEVDSLPAMSSTGRGGNGSFGMYWLQQQPPPFDTAKVSSFLETLLAYSTEFWSDESDQPYRVFIRVNEDLGSSSRTIGAGGTALLRSFTVGYYNAGGVEAGQLRTLLAHEMTHNWTPWISGTTAEQSRYNEGSAEYWSLRLLWRAGLLTSYEYLDEMNTRAYNYYTNSAVNLSDSAAQDVAWQIRDAQRIPYGRGMLHLTNIDARIRAATNGTESLDGLAQEYVRKCRITAGCGAETWFPILKDALGQEALDEWARVTTGWPLIKPDAGSLGPCFNVVLNSTNPTVWAWKAKEGVDISSAECLI
ncbi:peptidase m61 domain-containing protein [Colletotrichum sojae]|uniref:Peptidase m61 domain-containing protein n=1 Tax=Colletotrichum sojae TaxID=2175907 RepID=A0A8H6MRM1_9PEZI|nr:peptidase m61 domain-containing protein [Colletotrichum sojae]